MLNPNPMTLFREESPTVAYSPMAKAAGASREEIRDTILLTLTISGVKGVVSCLPAALACHENCQ